MTSSAKVDYALPWVLLGAGFLAIPATLGIMYADTRFWQGLTIFLSLAVIWTTAIVTQIYWTRYLGKYTAAAAMSLALGAMIALVVAPSQPCLGNFQGYTDPCTAADTASWVVSTSLGWMLLCVTVFLAVGFFKLLSRLLHRMWRH